MQSQWLIGVEQSSAQWPSRTAKFHLSLFHTQPPTAAAPIQSLGRCRVDTLTIPPKYQKTPENTRKHPRHPQKHTHTQLTQRS